MRARVCRLALMIGLMPVVAAAQDGLRSASLPERPLASSQSMRDDVYLARPGTYRRVPNRPRLPVFGYVEPQPLYPSYVPPIIVIQVPRDAADSANAVPPAPAAPPTPYVAGMPGQSKTFYVIPGCYAGDRRPEPESLPPDCDLTSLRVVPPS